MSKLLLSRRQALLLALAASISTASFAETDYPSKEIKLYVGYGAGGVGDVSARLLAQVMEKDLKVPIVVMNRPGAQATINPAQLMRQEGDGYNVGVLTFAPMAIVPHMQPVPYTTKDFTFAGAFGRFQYGLAVRADSPYQSVADLVAAAKKGKSVFFGAPGAPNNLAMYELGEKTGAKFEQVLYKSGNETVMALVGGEVEAIIQTPSEIRPHVESGKLRLLASVSPARWADRPDMPTVTEAGFDVKIESWMGLAVPKSTPPAIVKRLEDSMLKAMQDKELIDAYLRMGIDPVSISGADYTRMVEEGYVQMGEAMKELGLVSK